VGCCLQGSGPQACSALMILCTFKFTSLSYREAFPKSRNWQSDSAWVKASKLAAKVQPRIEELRTKALHSVTIGILVLAIALAFLG
jgi:hypothetical protein